MTLYEYIPQALATESAKDPISDDAKKLGANPRAIHAVIGLTTEIPEILDALEFDGDLEVFEELSDLMWYNAIIIDVIAQETGDKHTDIIFAINGQVKDASLLKDDDMIEEDSINLIMNLITTAVGRSMDMYKKCMFYGKDLYKTEADKLIAIQELFRTVLEVTFGVHQLIDILNKRDKQFTFASCLNANIAKLKKRYPDKFTERDAEDRDTESEYDAMRAVLKNNNT